MKRVALALVAVSGALLAQSGISPPLAGYVKDRNGALRPVFGLAGSLVLGKPIAEGVISAAFTGRIGFTKTPDSLYAFDPEGQLLGRVDAPEGPAFFLIAPGGAETLVCLSTPSETVLWKDGGFHSGPPAGCDAPALPLFSDGDTLVLRKADGTELRTQIEGPPLSIEQMGEGWHSVQQAQRILAIRVREDRLETYRLPEAAP